MHLRRSPLAGLAVRTGWWRGFKLARGYWRTYVRNSYAPYDPGPWWDAWHEAAGRSDADTIEPGIDQLESKYHYATIEALILATLHRHGQPSQVLDLGSGAGHWLAFYQSLGAEVTGLELSAEAVGRLREQYPTVEEGDIASMELTGFDLVNAIGVMFHIVDDAAHLEAIAAIDRALRPGGLLIVSGGFPLVTVNVQFDGNGQVNKRLRSRRYWRRQLTGLRSV